MRKFLATACVLMTLTACTGGNNGGLAGTSQVTLHQEQAFEVMVPTGWVEITREEVSELQKHFVVAFAKPDYVDGFATNLTVVTEDLVYIQDSQKYAQANMQAASRDVMDYQPLDKREITIKDGEGEQTTTLLIFEGRYRKTDPLTKFMQMYLVKNRKGYVMTVNIPYSEDGYDKYIDSLFSTFRFY